MMHMGVPVEVHNQQHVDKSNNTGMPGEGSTVRLIGLKNPDLNEKIGTITSYSRDGERVMVTLMEGSRSIVKVKPKQMEVLEESSGRGGTGLRSSSMPPRTQPRSLSRDNRNDNGQRSSMMNRQASGRTQASGRSQGQGNMQGEIMETLRSADAIFELTDTSGDGIISQEEFEFYMKKNTDHDIKMIRECYFMIDADDNGDISRDEVRNAFVKKRRELQGGRPGMENANSDSNKKLEDELLGVSRDADALFDKADFDGSGSLSIGEFELYMKRNTKHSDAVIHQLFDSMDVDKDGFITREEVRNAYVEIKKASGGKKSLMDILGLEDDDMADIEDDVYNMFFLSEFGGASFWYAIFVFCVKLGLIIIIAVDLYTNNSFPDSSDVPPLVKTVQFMLLPVNVAVQEELITTFTIYANLKWSAQILELNPGATKGKFHFANFMRLVDGVVYFFVNTTLLFQTTEVLGAFMNFTALGFLSQIDNVAMELARDGYLNERLETVAGDVQLMKLPKNHNHRTQVMDSVMIAVLLLIELVAWILMMFVL